MPKNLETNATVVLDPTMLLNKSDYDNIIDSFSTEKHEKELLTYILNPNDESDSITSYVAKALSLTPNTSNSRYEDDGAPLVQKIQISVEQ